MPSPRLLMRSFIAREAVLSSRIEGTQATLGKILAQEVGANVDRNSSNLQEVRNYIATLEYGRLERLKSFPLSLQLIKEIRGKLMQGVRGSRAASGEFRCAQDWIGVPGYTITQQNGFHQHTR